MQYVVFSFEKVPQENIPIVFVNITVISSQKMVLAGPVKSGKIIPRHLWVYVMDHMKIVFQKQKGPKPLCLNHNGACADFFMGAMCEKST